MRRRWFAQHREAFVDPTHFPRWGARFVAIAENMKPALEFHNFNGFIRIVGKAGTVLIGADHREWLVRSRS
jgi:hypothetical protein